MPIFLLLGILPVAAGAAVEYLVCRLLKKRFWRWLPPFAVLLVTAIVFCVRYFGWSAEAGAGNAPLETLLFIPVLPAVLVFLGLFLGWRIWKRRWSPRVVRDR